MRFLAWFILLAATAVHARDRSGTCSPCAFMNQTAVATCSPLMKYDGWRHKDYAYVRFLHEVICLGQPEGEPATNILRVQNNVKYMGDYEWYQREDSINVVNVYGQRVQMTVDYFPDKSVFAQVLYRSVPEEKDLASGIAPWTAPAWPPSDETTVILVGASEANSTVDPEHHLFLDPVEYFEANRGGKIHALTDGAIYLDQWYTHGCRAPWPLCLPSGWNAAMISGALPVFVYSIWCSGGPSTGLAPTNLGCSTSNNCNYNASRCETTQQQDRDPAYCAEENRNRCTNSGLCKCRPDSGGATCEQKLPKSSTPLPEPQRGPHDMINTRLPAEWSDDPYSKETDTADWDFWTCATYNPCSGAGKCVDSFGYNQQTRRFRPVPRCECYPGFFGNSSTQMDAYANVFFCDKEANAKWQDVAANGYPIRRYMMLHQCMLWNGPNSPPNYVRAPTERVDDLKRPIIALRPVMPPKCATGFVGGRCLPCPLCVAKQGTCKAVGDDQSLAVCECTPDFTGALCQIPICPMYPPTLGSPCGARALPAPRGACVLATNDTTLVVPYADIKVSPYRCSCDNGYSGLACQHRQCAVPKGSKPEIAALMCSGSSLTRYGPKVSEPHGECKSIGNGTTGICVCLPQYTGTNCELMRCPVVMTPNGTELVCNGLLYYDARKTGAKRSVCFNSNPDEYPICQCDKARPSLEDRKDMTPEDVRSLMYRLSFYGDACQYSYNTTCLNVAALGTDAATESSEATEWCSSRTEGVARCQIETTAGGGSLYPPRCICGESNTLTGTWCEQSKCGVRYMKTEAVQERKVCMGYDGGRVLSGLCRLLATDKTRDRSTDSVSDPFFYDRVERASVQVQSFGLCQCLSNVTIEAINLGTKTGITTLQTGFIGSYCQTAVPGCSSNNRICSNELGEAHGACVIVPETETLRPINEVGGNNLNGDTTRFRHRCSCLAGFNGTYCQTRIAVCHPQCRPGAGICELVPGSAATCKCRNAKYIYTDPRDPNEQCSVDLCSQTGGTTSLETAACLCPAGRWSTAIKDHVAGCRFMCPVDPETGFECGLPGESGAQLCSNYPTDEAGVFAANMSNTILNNRDLHCRCGGAKWNPTTNVPDHIGDAAYVDGNRERIMWAPDGILCMPMCGHDSHDTAESKACECRPSDDDFDPPCGQYMKGFYQTHQCSNRGTYSRRSERCTCRDPTWFTSASKCALTTCAPEGNVQDPAVAAVCNCTYPYRADTDRFSPTFRRCVGVCLNGGVPNVATRKCVCAGVFSGKYCEIDTCAPFGAACPGGKTCCCSTPVVAGPKCDQSACGAHGKLVKLPLPPSCTCDAFWTGVTCQTDTCGIVGDGDIITGTFKSGACECKPGYSRDRTGRCTVPLCGVQGTVVQAPNVRTPQVGYKCECHAPSEVDPFGVCTQGSCGQGSLIEGVGGEKVQCQCNPGWTGPKCNVPKCGVNERIAFVNGHCVCLYPYGGDEQCSQTQCGEGGIGVVLISAPDNPPQYECKCNTKAGYALEEDLDARRKGVPCVRLCNVNGTVRIDANQGCICKLGYVGLWCDSPQRYEPTECPKLPDAVVTTTGDFSKQTYYGSVFGVSAGFLVIVIALSVVLAKQSGGERGTGVEKKRLVQ